MTDRARRAGKPADFIRAQLPLAAPPIVPEIRLHLARPASGVARLVSATGGPPYWAYCWAGGLALARHLLDHPTTVAGLRILDLGSGAGIVAIAAALAGARQVIAADVDQNAITAIGLNAEANGVGVTTLHGDLTAEAPPRVDLVCVGDLFYEKNIADRVVAFLDRCAAAGIPALVGDPGRAHLPLSRLRFIKGYEVPDFGDVGTAGRSPSAVYAFLPSVMPVEVGTLDPAAG